MNRPDVARDLIYDYAKADFEKRYVGYFEIPQEDARELALYILESESIGKKEGE